MTKVKTKNSFFVIDEEMTAMTSAACNACMHATTDAEQMKVNFYCTWNTSEKALPSRKYKYLNQALFVMRCVANPSVIGYTF